MRKRNSAIALVAVAFLFLSGCSKEETEEKINLKTGVVDKKNHGKLKTGGNSNSYSQKDVVVNEKEIPRMSSKERFTRQQMKVFKFIDAINKIDIEKMATLVSADELPQYESGFEQIKKGRLNNSSFNIGKDVYNFYSKDFKPLITEVSASTMGNWVDYKLKNQNPPEGTSENGVENIRYVRVMKAENPYKDYPIISPLNNFK